MNCRRTVLNGRWSLGTKLGVAFALMAIIVASFLTLGFQQVATNWLRDGLRDRIRDAVAIAATQLDGGAFVGLNRIEQESSATYLSLRKRLQSIRDAGNGYRFVYTMRQVADGRIMFVVDAEEDPADRSALGDIYESPGPVLLANVERLDQPLVEEEFYTDKWGTWLTGYAPVLGPGGRQEVILAMDVAASSVLAHERQALLVAIAGFVLMVLLAVLLGGLLGRRLAEPIVALTRGVERVGVGEFNQLVNIRSNDETRDLALAFNTMTQDLGASLAALRSSEEELKRHRNQLEVLVRERTAELTAVVARLRHEIEAREAHERELINAKADAETANRAKSQFLANMSHEIRTPLNGIIGMTDILMDSELTSVQREHQGMVQRSARALLAILNDILDLSKIEANKLSLEKTDFALRDTLADAVEGLVARAVEKKLQLDWRVAQDVPDLLVGDPVRLRQVVVNLVGNGIKFCDAGEVVVEVRLVTQSQGDVRLQFEVRDTGIGIEAEKQEEIFKAFAQADASTTRQYGGTGLGLTICARLVALMGGKLSVDSVAGLGSAFRFELEFATQADSPMRRLVSSLEGVRVLVVDGDSVDLATLGEVLANLGMQPALVDSVAGALDTLRRAAAEDRSYPLVLTAAVLSDQSGFDLVTAIGADSALADARVLVFAAEGDLTAIASRASQLGVPLWCAKPFRRCSMLEAIGKALDVEVPRQATRYHAERAQRSLLLLLVDDVLANQQVATWYLQRLGHQVVAASNGQQALVRWQEGNYDAILMDVQMPVMDGLKATAEIRRLEQGARRIPIIAMTAHAMKGDRESFLAAGMDDYIAKPLALKELANCLARVLEN